MKMHDLVAAFPQQLLRALEITRKAAISPPSREIRHILITGLGGSGIGGTIVGEWFRDALAVPVIMSKEYHIPAFVDGHTLVIACSYSGNTEETISSLNLAIKAGAQISCITSGGKVAEIANNHGFDIVNIDGGRPPRSCIGYALVALMKVLQGKGLITNAYEKEIEISAEMIEKEQEELMSAARTTAELLEGKIPVIYADAAMEGIAVRFRQQIDENAKMLSWHHVIPEMNHNELVGWRGEYPRIAVVFLRNDNDDPRNQLRMEFVSRVVKPYAGQVLELWSHGESSIQRGLYLIHLTDWVSCYLSDLNGKDAIEIDVINRLKDTLAAHSLKN